MYGEHPLSNEEMRKRFVGQSSDNSMGYSSKISEIHPIETPKGLSEQVKLLEDIGFVATKIEDDVPF